MNPSNAVLIIEDSADTAEMLSILLKMKGVASQCFSDRAKALKSFIANPVSLIVMDLHMPGMTAEEFIAHVRSVSLVTRIILASADAELPFRAVELCADEYLAKPFSPDRFFVAIKPFISFAAD